MSNLDSVRADFPILGRQITGQPLAYLDSANTSQKPQVVIDAMADHYLRHNANVARAMHTLGAEASAAFEGARGKVSRFIGAARPEEIIFTKNASEALNLAAHTLGARLRPGDEVVVSVLEHHSNIVPWQLLCARTGAVLRWFDVTEEGRLDLESARESGLVNERTKIVALSWVSNVTGLVNPVAEVAAWAHSVGATFVVDGSQGVPHLPTKIAELGADLLAFTGHKMCGPTGIGVLWGHYELLAELPPFLGGGEMIEVVKMTGSTFAAPPYRFEAGTPPIAQAVGLGAAVDYLSEIGMVEIARRDRVLAAQMLAGLERLPGVRLLAPGPVEDRVATLAFTLNTAEGAEIHPHDVMTLLDARGVAVRGGHHCARPLHERLGVQSSVRASAYFYTSTDELDQLFSALEYTRDFFGRRR